ncbi:MAG TPA: glycine cleavage T C-terminal barrel domain-containing protein [Tepidisphaeraceae bacterium]|jgi:folate-binding protein YgfZ
MPSSSPNPLREVHRQAEAEFQNWAETEIVQTFGEPQAEYAAIRKSVGLMDLPQRGVLELTGKDRLTFLNNLITNQTWDKQAKKGLEAGRGVYAFLLNLKGRVVADLNVLELGDRTLIETESRLVEPVRSVLEKYVFTEQVKMISRVGQLHEIALHGPKAIDVLGVGLVDQQGVSKTQLFDAEPIFWRDDSAGVPGYNLIIPTELARVLWMKLIDHLGGERGKRVLRPVGWAAFNATRIEAGRPVFGIDFDGAPVASAAPGSKDDSNTGALPAETGLFERAVSVTKGCYLGQEIVARMHARGQVARQVVGVRMEGDALPIAGEQVFDADGASPIGVITSSTVSPVLSNAAIAFAMIKRPHFGVGAKLKVPAEGAMRDATVVELPFIRHAGNK